MSFWSRNNKLQSYQTNHIMHLCSNSIVFMSIATNMKVKEREVSFLKVLKNYASLIRLYLYVEKQLCIKTIMSYSTIIFKNLFLNKKYSVFNLCLKQTIDFLFKNHILIGL